MCVHFIADIHVHVYFTVEFTSAPPTPPKRQCMDIARPPPRPAPRSTATVARAPLDQTPGPATCGDGDPLPMDDCLTIHVPSSIHKVVIVQGGRRTTFEV